MNKSIRSRALTSAAGLLLAGTLTANAEDIVIWGGFPELTEYYERVAESLSGKYPDLNVVVEPIGLRDHEKRVALGLSSGLDNATVLELIGSTANRYIVNDLIQPAPDGVSAFVNDDSNFEAFSRILLLSTVRYMAYQFSEVRVHCFTTLTCSRQQVWKARQQRWTNMMNTLRS